MRMVEFTRDMRPQRAGARRVLPDGVADRLIAAGDAKAVASVFDAAPKPAEAQAPKTRYLTRKAR